MNLLSDLLPYGYLPSYAIDTHSNAFIVLKFFFLKIKIELSRSPLDRWNDLSLTDRTELTNSRFLLLWIWKACSKCLDLHDYIYILILNKLATLG